MSRVGLKPIQILSGTTVDLDNHQVKVTGPSGSLSFSLPEEIKVLRKDETLLVVRRNDSISAKSLHGLTRSLINNAFLGLTTGWRKDLEIQGTGFWAKMEGTTLVISVGFSHLVKMEPPTGIKFAVEGKNQIVVTGSDKIQVGNVAAKIRAVKPPDHYKGKGIRYLGEVVRLKAGKAGKAGAAA